jgi:hypothetical protein
MSDTVKKAAPDAPITPAPPVPTVPPAPTTPAPPVVDAEKADLQRQIAELTARLATPAPIVVAPAAPEGTTLYVNKEGEERHFTSETYALLAPDYAGFEVKPEKPEPLAK